MSQTSNEDLPDTITVNGHLYERVDPIDELFEPGSIYTRAANTIAAIQVIAKRLDCTEQQAAWALVYHDRGVNEPAQAYPTGPTDSALAKAVRHELQKTLAEAV